MASDELSKGLFGRCRLVVHVPVEAQPEVVHQGLGPRFALQRHIGVVHGSSEVCSVCSLVFQFAAVFASLFGFGFRLCRVVSVWRGEYVGGEDCERHELSLCQMRVS